MANIEQYIAELQQIAAEAADLSTEFETSEMAGQVESLLDAIAAVEQSWSGSNFGYHARVYYGDFQPKAADHPFSVASGLVRGRPSVNYGWQEHSEADVRAHVLALAGDVDLVEMQRVSEDARRSIPRMRSAIESIVSNCLSIRDDRYLTDIADAVGKVAPPNAATLARRYVATGKTIRTRDMRAVNEGSTVAPHQRLRGEAEAIRAPYLCANTLADYATNAAAHLARYPEATSAVAEMSQLGSRVFIGHGRSPQWMELKNYIVDRVGVPVDEFNRVPTAGIATVNRLSEMLDAAAMAFLVMTAEDETADGSLRARQNVVHEVGLFQGRLGFDKAIVMIEEGCESFSNIHGLTELYYPKGNISAKFYEVRDLLEREGLI